MLRIDWFLHGHEHRNDYFRFALMRRHLAGQLELRVRPINESPEHGFSPRPEDVDFRHTSIFTASRGTTRLRVGIDNEDGFIHLSPLIRDVDLYFCCPYNRRFHVERQFIKPYPWQTEEDVRWHRQQGEKVLAQYGDDQFKKIVPLGPTPTDLVNRGEKPLTWPRQKQRNVAHKLSSAVRKVLPGLMGPGWEKDYRQFKRRYEQMLGYRNLSLGKDIVSREALWRTGWPAHRIRLHEGLYALKGRWKVLGQLTESDGQAEWTPETKQRLGQPFQLERSFEEEILSCRLPVFPTGAHWGWRGIVFLTLCVGNRCYIDRPIYEPYFPFDEFDCVYNDGKWAQLEEHLQATTDQEWSRARERNQAVFERRLSPEAYSEYILAEIHRRL